MGRFTSEDRQAPAVNKNSPRKTKSKKLIFSFIDNESARLVTIAEIKTTAYTFKGNNCNSFFSLFANFAVRLISATETVFLIIPKN